MLRHLMALTLIFVGSIACFAEDPKKIVLIAGRPSSTRMHEFNAGSQLLAACIKDVPGVKLEVVLNGWRRTSPFSKVLRPSCSMDGGAGHEAVQQEGRRD